MKIWILRGALLIWVMLPFVFFALPIDYFDEGQSKCLSVVLLGEVCPACGLTRGMMRLLHFDLEGAYRLNKLTFILFLIIGYLWLVWFRKLYRKVF